MRLTACICVLMVGVLWSPLCVSAMPETQEQEQKGGPADVLTIFLTGNEFGALKPCGCSGGQLGGLDRRSAIFDSVTASKRLIVDTGALVEGDSEQELIKFNIIIQAFGFLNYDLVNLTERDVEITRNLGLLDSIGSVVYIISYQKSADINLPTRFTKELPLQNKAVAVTVAAFDAESSPIEQAENLFTARAGSQSANILILNRCDEGIVESIAKTGTVDCLVCPSESDYPEIIGVPSEKPLVLSVGLYGKYVGRLQIKADEAGDGLKFSFSSVPVTEDLPQEKSLVELYKVYQQLVKSENLLDKQPRFSLSNGLDYVGSKSCGLCHRYEYKKWSGNPHGRAYATLEKVGSQYDPECVICHVVGLEYQSGFVSQEQTSYLRNVGCESCHGPGSEHIKTFGEARTAGPMSDCTDCHTPDYSGEYGANEQLYFEKIVHWKEPNAAGDVKKDSE